MPPLARSLLILLYSLVFTVLAPLLRLLARVAPPRLRAQVLGRRPVPALAAELARTRARYRHCVVFFCSSAGEFEQAQPLIGRLQALGNVYVQVFFFSRAGLEFVQARKEEVACCLSPLTDSVWHWGWLFAALRPDIIAVVRHELWPGFLEAARSYGRLCLIDASRSAGEIQSPTKRFVRAQLLGLFQQIYTVSPADQAYFQGEYRLPADRVLAVGDTKYDRVRERAKAKVAAGAQLQGIFDRFAPTAGARRLIIGSAYKPEVELLLAAWRSRGSAAAGWQVIIAPHHPTADLVGWILERCREAGLTAERYTALAPSAETPARPLQIIVLDTMGMLADAYGTAQAALVGGGLQGKVHNVLEPACHGLALAYGPFYKNSQEAIHLVDRGLAAVVENAGDLTAWWQRLDTDGNGRAGKMMAAVDNLAGASDRILADWRPVFGK